MQYSRIVPLLVLLLLGSACSRPDAVSNSNSAPAPSSIRGLSLSPEEYSAEGLGKFFKNFPEAGSYISWAGPAKDLNQPSGSPNLVLTRANEKGLVPIIIVSPGEADLQNDGDWKIWRDQLVVFAKNSQVPYLGIGNETNKNLSPTALQYFAGQFQLLVDDIHQTSPQTKVFTVLQLEWMKGLRGGLFGAKNDPAKTQWDILASFRFGDLIAFSSYPGLIYKNPSDIPETYYSDIVQHTDRPLAFTELGWFRTGPKGWESSSGEQVEFIHRFFPLVEPIHPIFTLWSFLYDQTAPAPFTTMGLVPAGQTTSDAWEAWRTTNK